MDNAADRKIDRTAQITSQSTHRHTDQQRDQLDGDTHGHRGACAVDQAAQIITPDFICPQGILGVDTGQQPHRRKVGFVIRVRGQQIGKNGEKEKENHNHQAKDSQTIPEKAANRILQEGAMLAQRNRNSRVGNGHTCLPRVCSTGHYWPSCPPNRTRGSNRV
jgi:hypothetical protein